MNGIVIYTDGGCSGNPGPGGWAFVLKDGSSEHEASGGDGATTNNRMELTAVIAALREAERREAERIGASDGAIPVVLYTDSQYVKNGITSWITAWKRNGWRTADKKPVKNKELWEELDAVASRVRPKFLWVEGHAGVDGNERCDALVQAEIRKLRAR
ncbi:MAG: ribonuclease HI [Spirochaetaceae bacterium]|nr:ribonuclease HI [Spirochaetaceae bacterium]